MGQNECAEPYAAAVGGINIDIGGKSFRPLILHDSNPGRVQISLGGVGRNIAHNMRLLGLKVSFLTAFGDDMHARRIEESCARLGIDISCARIIHGGASSVYLYLNGSDGEMALAVSDMEICREITPAYLEENIRLLDNARVVVADCNIPGETLCWLAEHCRTPIFADPVSVSKAKKLLPVLGKIHTLKPNRLEAQALSGIEITDEESMKAAADRLLEAGIQRVFISLGAEGVYAANTREAFLLPAARTFVQSTTGAGDAFMAGLVWADSEGMRLKESALAAQAAAAIATESMETINEQLSAAAVRERMFAAGGQPGGAEEYETISGYQPGSDKSFE